MAKKATKKAAKKAAPKFAAKAPSKKAAAADAPAHDHMLCGEKVQLHIHNVSKSTANWIVTGGGQKIRGCTPAAGEGAVRVEHCKKYKITIWGKDPKKKEAANLGSDGSAIYNGRGIAVTHPH